MDGSDQVTIAFRIPGLWTHPKDLVEALPQGHRLTPEALILPDGTEVGFGAGAADDQFARIFRSSCRQPHGVTRLKRFISQITGKPCN
jgi:hypothetical protein